MNDWAAPYVAAYMMACLHIVLGKEKLWHCTPIPHSQKLVKTSTLTQVRLDMLTTAEVETFLTKLHEFTQQKK